MISHFYSQFMRARMSAWLLISVVLMIIVGFLAQHLMAVFIFKVGQVVFAGWIAFWFDRAVFHYARPDMFCTISETSSGPLVVVKGGCEMMFSLAQLRRAIIIAAAMLAVALGA